MTAGTAVERYPAVRVADRHRRRRTPWLTLVACAYAVVQLVLVVPRTGHALGWDESVYVSQFDPRTPAAYFSAPRSRGLSYLTAPVVALTDSVLALRLTLVVLSTTALYCAYRTWRPLLGDTTAALAALLFAGLWSAQLAGSQAMPNLWVALGAVAAVGWFLRAPREPRARWWLAAILLGITLVRLPDAGWLALPLLVTALWFRARRHTVPFLLGGLVLGATPWVVEAQLRFGGVTGRLHRSSATEGGMSWHINTGNAWRSLNGPQLCRPCHVPLTHPELTLWWLALPLLAAVALLVAAHDRRTRPLTLTTLPLLCACTLSFPYLFLLGYSAPRFLLPAYALLSLPLAASAVRVLAAGRRTWPVTAAVVVVVCLQLVGQAVLLPGISARAAVVSQRYRTAAHALNSLGLRPPCLITGRSALPVAYAAGCTSAELHGNNRSLTRGALLDRTRLMPAAVLVPREHRQPRYARHWIRHRLPGTPWTAYTPR
ncbi:glycosyltransferase family 39 protein [Streptomyces sp. NPDC102365]|uniref:glycosyltransferase family 39 protein n=1 Tax=Streptomyces sp. NPDC102365 TaxID=3366162 RepID=UPI0038174EBE